MGVDGGAPSREEAGKEAARGGTPSASRERPERMCHKKSEYARLAHRAVLVHALYCRRLDAKHLAATIHVDQPDLLACERPTF